MQDKYIKDFVIALSMIMLVVFLIQGVRLYQQANKVLPESKYKKIALSQKLIKQIQEIESSIQDRKMFVFSVVKDPLEQNLIVKTKVDLENNWKSMVESMMRLSATYSDSNGQRRATIAYEGKNYDVHVGDFIAGRKIIDIQQGRVYFSQGGVKGLLDLQPVPAKPVELQDNKKIYNW